MTLARLAADPAGKMPLPHGEGQGAYFLLLPELLLLELSLPPRSWVAA